jgi:hypothetical protein
MERTGVTAVLEDLAAQRITADQAAERFRTLPWVAHVRSGPPVTTGAQLLERAAQDPDPLTPGSWDEVAVAFAMGDVPMDHYDTLLAAYKDATAGQ